MKSRRKAFQYALDIDFGSSTQFAQPFLVLSVNQDGFTSGRLDGLEIDASGTIRANYTNGQNNPLGKIVVANFNNQNGLSKLVMLHMLKQPFQEQLKLEKLERRALVTFSPVH